MSSLFIFTNHLVIKPTHFSGGNRLCVHLNPDFEFIGRVVPQTKALVRARQTRYRATFCEQKGNVTPKVSRIDNDVELVMQYAGKMV